LALSVPEQLTEVHDVAPFWRRGFVASKGDPFILFRSIPDIAASLAEVGRTT
jgi:hypothetical protein